MPRRACAREPVLGDPHPQRRPLHEVRVAVSVSVRVRVRVRIRLPTLTLPLTLTS